MKAAGKADGPHMTKVTYLPPINAPITAYATIYKVFHIILSRAKQAELPYADITFDVAAGIMLGAYESQMAELNGTRDI